MKYYVQKVVVKKNVTLIRWMGADKKYYLSTRFGLSRLGCVGIYQEVLCNKNKQNQFFIYNI